jgi:acyl-homoserine lactone acylase PvdQ
MFQDIETDSKDVPIISVKHPFPTNGTYNYQQQFLDLHLCPDIKCAADALSKVDGIPSDYVLVDDKSVYHVVSGTFPVRREKGSGHKMRTPFETENWVGFVQPENKPAGNDPKEGFYVGGSTTPLYKETAMVTRTKNLLKKKLA